MLMFILVAVFLAGLMVGRAPEFLGKKIGPFEMKMAALAILLPPLVILVFSAVAVLHPLGLSARSNPGPHGLSQILYWLSSTTGNNGSAFAGYGSDNILCNSLGAIAMLVGRYWVMLPVLAIAGSLSRQSAVPATAGTLPTHTPLFAVFLLMTIIAVGALNFLPVLALGPMVEHLMMIQGGS
jgi:K+-transporting ATPase ATPase A chain